MEKTMRNYGTIVRIAALGASLALATLTQAGAAETPPSAIRLAGPGNASGAPYGNGVLGVIRAKKLLEEEFKTDGIKIDWQFPRGTGPAINEAFANGQLDFSNYGGLPNIVGRGAGLRTKVLASNGSSPVYIVARKDAKIESVSDIKGKKISVSRGTIYEWSINRILAKSGLSERDVQIFDLQSADQISAFSSGDIDAIVAGNNLLELVDRGLGKTIYTTKGTLGAGTNFGSLVVSDNFARKYPETTQRVVNVYIKAAYYASQEENRNELYDIWTLTGVPRVAFSKDFDGDPLRERLNPLLDDFYLGNVVSGINFAVGSKLIRAPFKPEDWIDRSYQDKAIKELGYTGFWRAHDEDGKPKS
jgi:sulfonate transport system substrate-binding protein